MPIIDLRPHILSAAGTWQDSAALANETPFTFTLADTRGADRLLLRWEGDSVTLAGPLRIRITFQTENLTYEMGAWSGQQTGQTGIELVGDGTESFAEVPVQSSGLEINANVSLLGAATLQASTVYSYTLDIPAGQVWPFVYGARTSIHEMGANFYDRVLIEVAGLDSVKIPVAVGDLPCNLAVTDVPDTASFFPTACEPCDPSAQVRMPTLAPALSVQAAGGGCVHTRFFNGMSITKEDLETEQRYFRIKNRLHNRTIGQGVVWGLNVGKQTEQICVLPGYAIDCCGNDLTVTTVYKVDIAALLRDPAAADACATSTGTAQRMHLLLEYVECPSEPRPVHGDPCAPGQQLCEPSRVRETVRLRLVPPRDPDTSGPLRDFLATAQTLHDKYRDQLFTRPDEAAKTTMPEAVLSVETDVGQRLVVSEDAVSIQGNEATFTAKVSEGVFTGGMLRITNADDGSLIDEMPLALFSLRSARGLTIDLDPGSAYVVELTNWRAESPLAPAPGWAYIGAVTYDITSSDEASSAAGGWNVEIREPSLPVQGSFVRRSPVCGDPCATPDRSRRVSGPCDSRASKASSIPWPWLHDDPLHPSRAGDPKAVILGVLGAWLKHSGASSAEANEAESWSLQRLAATLIYRTAWLLFYGVDAADEKEDVGEAVQSLLRGWCEAALYPGPVCAGDPHGVVIGCTTLKAGAIGDIDPFGGRRYVVQYPLLSHWASQIGLAPFDAAIPRLSSLLCCVAGLPNPTTASEAPAFIYKLAEVQGEDIVVDGASMPTTERLYLASGTEEGLAAAYQEETNAAWDVAATYEVGFLSFADHVIQGLLGDLPSATVEPWTGGDPVIERYTLGGPVQPGVISLLVTRGG